MTVKEAMECKQSTAIRIDPESPDNWWMSPSGSNAWCRIGDMKRLMDAHDILVAEVKRLDIRLANTEAGIDDIICDDHQTVGDLHNQHQDLGGDCLFCTCKTLVAEVERLLSDNTILRRALTRTHAKHIGDNVLSDSTSPCPYCGKEIEVRPLRYMRRYGGRNHLSI
jgi:hypothetical protein